MELRRIPKERATRVALFLGGEELSGVSVHDLEMRVGDVPARMGGVGGVGTKEERRGKGYARKVMEDSTRFMREAGLHVAVLFGIRDFYPKFGYAVCMAECALSLSTRHAEGARASFTFSPAAECDLEPARRLYQETNSRRTGSVVRREGVWRGFRKGSDYRSGTKLFAAKRASGGLEAYVLLDESPEETRSAELAARSLEGYESAVRFLAEDAIGKRAGEIRVFCPYDHPFVACASRFGVEIRLVRPRCGDAMGRVINQQSLFEKLVPLLSRRLNSSDLRGERFAVSVSTELGRTTVAFDGEEVGLEGSASACSCEIAASGLMQLVTGYCDPTAAGAKFDVKPAGELAARALGALFPRQEAYMWRPDRF